MDIRYSKKVLKFLAKQESSTATRIRNAVVKLTYDPPIGDIKALQGQSGTFRLRVGSFRVIYWYGKDGNVEILFIDEIENRGDIYK